jgi:hypothetical protein
MRGVPAVLRSLRWVAALLIAAAFAGPLRAQTPSAPAAPAAAAAAQANSPTAPQAVAQGNAQGEAQGNAQGGAQAGAQAGPEPTVIDYTGSLLGYYRMEAGDSTVVLAPVQKFLGYRAGAAAKDRLLLGMGDNFGPEFGASLQLENDNQLGRATHCYEPPKDTSDGESRPESLYKDDDRVALRAQCDNVLNFMIHAGFRAVVPGSQDFMYTARWLRASALLLQDAARDREQLGLIQNRDHRLDLLGANLRIAVKGKGGGQGQGKGGHAGGGSAGGGSGGGTQCPLLFAPDPFASGTMHCVGDEPSPEPLDWLDRLDRLAAQTGPSSTVTVLQQLATDSAAKATARQSELDALVGDEITIMSTAWGQRFAIPTLGGAHRGKGAKAQSDGLDEAEIGNLDAALRAMPDCQSASKPDDNADGDRDDMCLYAARLGHILRCRNIFVHQPPNPHPGSAAPSDPSVDACPAQGAAGADAAGTSGKPPRVTGADLTLDKASRDAARRGLLRTIALEERNVGYTVATTDNGQKVLVIGVAGQDAMQAVSQTNLTLCLATPGHWNGGDVFGRCGDKEKSGPGGDTGDSTVLVTDPVQVAEALVRGANLVDGGPFNRVVVMAQMPHTEAEVLSERISARLRLAGPNQGAQPVDAVLSEAESGYGSPELTVSYPNATQANYPAPVLTPLNSYSSQPDQYVYPGAISEVTLVSGPDRKFIVKNEPSGIFDPPVLGASNSGGTRTTVTLLYQLMNCLLQARAQNGGRSNPAGGQQGIDQCLADPPPSGFHGTTTTSSQEAEFALLKDLQESRRPRPDVVLLQSRDVELDQMGSGYMGYEMCDNEKDAEKQHLCMVRSALDRIFWKGDYVAYVSVTGKDLINILNLSEQKMAEQAELADTGYTREWVITYGIVQSALTNITEISRNNEPLWIPVDPNCKGESSAQSTYCIGGTPIANDAYYWLLTTDQLAQDKAVYGTLQSLPGTEHQPTELFITAPLAHALLASLHGPIQSIEDDAALAPSSGPPAARGGATAPSNGTASAQRNSAAVERTVTYNNEIFQQKRLFQVDFSKIVASFTSRQPVGGNAFVANFQGVSDSRATAPGQQELDLEAASRVTTNAPEFFAKGHLLPPTSFGVQTSFAYDRSVLGNLTPQTRPINASYSLNNFTVGGFLQIRLHRRQPDGQIVAVRSIPRSLLVFTPRQYQVQINHQYLFFPFAAAASPPGELTVPLPRNDIWTDRGGFREEFGQNRPTSFFGTGSYVETGVEFSSQANVLSSVTLQDGATGTPFTCKVSANSTLQACFTADKLAINSTTHLVSPPAVKTLHSPGFYWQLHIQNRVWGKQPNKSLSLVTDSQGDYYTGRPANLELPTQTEYAIPLSLSVLFPSIGNLSFAPSYSAFFYKSQLSAQSLQINSLSIAARWYFARDARVPIRRQARLPGPASADQTKTGKAH